VIGVPGTATGVGKTLPWRPCALPKQASQFNYARSGMPIANTPATHPLNIALFFLPSFTLLSNLQLQLPTLHYAH
jgi:hypothetical protein